MGERLSVDVNDGLERSSGSGGLKPEQLSSFQPEVEAAHARMLKRAGGRLPAFMGLPSAAQAIGEAEALGRELGGRYDNLVVLGIGGSSLGPKAAFSALAHPFHNLRSRAERGGARLFFPDNSDPSTFAGLLETLDLERSCFAAITKSGGTAETWVQLLYVRGLLKGRFGEEGYRQRVVAVTDPEKGALRALAKSERLRSLPLPPEIGGRFSVLTAVGLLPLAAAGIDVRGLCAGAAAMAERCRSPRLDENPAYLAAATLYLLDTRKGRRTQVLMPYADALRDFGDWFVQLWGESLGKSPAVGPTPLRAVGATDQHSLLQLLMEGPQDKVVCFVTLGRPRVDLAVPREVPELDEVRYLAGHTFFELLCAEARATAASLAVAGRPSMALRLPELNPFALGELFMLFEVMTAFAGELYQVNPFDQPGVEGGKRLAFGLLGRAGYEKAKEAIESRPPPLPELIRA